jgi:TonB family protein
MDGVPRVSYYHFTMKNLLAKFAILPIGLLIFGQTPGSQPNPASTCVVRFVAPPYPRAAKDKRMMGTTVSELRVALDGSVSGVRTLRAHPVFESQVKDALKQWRFKPTNEEYKVEVTISFELDENSECTNKGTITPETYVSADLPTLVHVRTGVPCLVIENDSNKKSGKSHPSVRN